MSPVISGRDLSAGVTRVNITPQPAEGAFMTGYTSKPDMPAEGVHDPLYARVLVLADGSTTIALVTLDLISLNPGRLPELIRDLGVDSLLLAATHTHGGPLVLDLGEPYAENRSWPDSTPYLTWLEGRIAQAVASALSATTPVRMALGRGVADIAFNRRQLIDGEVDMVWGQNRDRSHDWGPVDPEVAVWRIDREDGTPLAVLANYACHPVVMGSGNRLFTADFPGAALDWLDSRLGGAMSFFLQGGCGDIDPYIDVQDDFTAVRNQGEELARTIESIYRSIGPNDALDLSSGLSWQERRQSFPRFGDHPGYQEVAYGVLRIGADLAFGVLPGEPFVELQLDLKRRSPVRHTLLLGYTNGYPGYFPTLRTHREGGYGASYGNTIHIQPPAGETMIDTMVETLTAPS
ncbi:MAG: neutral/alkaline non-lysosomal ceramidase N-terminal domain-containing protein [Candidatus Latescibacterota bacterium]|nr:neutral/alkaline non-lysosomal ceramidase N-terminal domain-containing protein [Candidatus Latescibacterota bacterium]